MCADRTALLPKLREPDESEAVRFGTRALSYSHLSLVAGETAALVGRASRVAVWADAAPETCAGLAGALSAGAAVVPLSPKLGQRELEHILADSQPELVLGAPGFAPPPALSGLPVHEVSLEVAGRALPEEPTGDSDALIVYTSGTTGMPKGVVLTREAIRSNLDAVARAWEWTDRDVLVHALPLFHVHGLILGLLGPLRVGGSLRHLVRFDTARVAEELSGAGTMLFGVPTMYRRLADDAERDPGIGRGMARARLLVSGSAALPATEHQRIARLTGQRVVERYGMSETIMNCGVRSSGDRRPGYVGVPFDGVELILVDDGGNRITASDDETVGEILVRGPNLFREYLNRPEDTRAAFTDGWFRTGDMATRSPDGYVRIVGRRATDMISSGGFRIGAGEIENVLLEHDAVSEVAVTGEQDPELGQRIVAWVVPGGAEISERELVEHVAGLLSFHKRPREVRFVRELPRNELGKIQKGKLGGEWASRHVFAG